MKKYCTMALSLALCGALFMGCGCSNSTANTTTPATVIPTIRETTAPSTAPTTQATTMPATEEATNPTDMYGDTSETAGENGVVEDTPSTGTQDGAAEKSRRANPMHPMNPMG